MKNLYNTCKPHDGGCCYVGGVLLFAGNNGRGDGAGISCHV